MVDNKVKQALMQYVCEGIDKVNRFNGFESNYASKNVMPCEVYDVLKLGYRIKDTKILLNGEVVGKVIRKYSNRKVHLTYKELKPTLVFND